MSVPAPARTRGSTLGIVALTVSSVVVVALAVTPYLTGTLDQLAADDTGLARHYADRTPAVQVAFSTHVAAGGLALLLSPWQLWPRLRHRHPGLHRRSGRVVVGAITIAGLAGLVLAPVNQAGLVGLLGFGLLAVLWLVTTWQGLRAIRAHDVARHRAWMVRAFALTFAGVTLRLWLGLLIGGQALVAGEALDAQVAFDRAYAVVPFLSWVPNLLVAEWIVRRRAGAVAVTPAVGPPREAPPTAPAA
ncbi:DUF2306 domain-containing protein [Isoptericola aurantiacus]|uniref:DUF2306 domain-containing protein n=1 Tax=Isoptericola aurantiacus TaxID=3377839 RepID=UPI00383BDE49